jgi:mono/diheme cytochrome c family protein
VTVQVFTNNQLRVRKIMTRKFLTIGMLVSVMLILAACGTAAEPAYQENQASEEAQAIDEGLTTEEVAQVPTNTPEPPTATPVPPTETSIPPSNTPEPTAVPTEEEVATEESVEPASTEEVAFGSDDPLYDAIAGADSASGEQLLVANGCAGCHSLDASEMVIVGPGLYNLLSRAAERVEGEGPYTYIYNSIVSPNDYVAEGFGANIMPPNFGDRLADEEIYDIVAYLATLQD